MDESVIVSQAGMIFEGCWVAKSFFVERKTKMERALEV